MRLLLLSLLLLLLEGVEHSGVADCEQGMEMGDFVTKALVEVISSVSPMILCHISLDNMFSCRYAKVLSFGYC